MVFVSQTAFLLLGGLAAPSAGFLRILTKLVVRLEKALKAATAATQLVERGAGQ
jgi:hypothetical protein